MNSYRYKWLASAVLIVFAALASDFACAMYQEPEENSDAAISRAVSRKNPPHALINVLEPELQPLAAYALGASPESIAEFLSVTGPDGSYGSLFRGVMSPPELLALVSIVLQKEISPPERFRSKRMSINRIRMETDTCVDMLSDVVTRPEDREKLRLRLNHLRLVLRLNRYEAEAGTHFQNDLATVKLPVSAVASFWHFPFGLQCILALDQKVIIPAAMVSFLERYEPPTLNEVLIRDITKNNTPTVHQMKWLSWLLGGVADNFSWEDAVRNLSLGSGSGAGARSVALAESMKQLSLVSDDLALIMLALRYTDQWTTKEVLKSHPHFKVLSDETDEELAAKIANKTVRQRIALIQRLKAATLKDLQTAMDRAGVVLAGWLPPEIISVTGAEDLKSFLELSSRLLQEDRVIPAEGRIKEVIGNLPDETPPLSSSPPSSLGRTLHIVIHSSGEAITLTFEEQDEIGRGSTGSLYRAQGSDGKSYVVKLTHAGRQHNQLNSLTNREGNQEFSSTETLQTMLGSEETEGMIFPIAHGTTERSQYLVYGYIEDGDFAAWLALQAGQISLELIIDLLISGLLPVNALHTNEAGFSHGDISLTNFLVQKSESGPRLLLSDFGYCLPEKAARAKVAAWRNENGQQTCPHFEDQTRYGIHADIYQLGKTLQFLYERFHHKLQARHALSLSQLKLIAESLLIPVPDISVNTVIERLKAIKQLEQNAAGKLAGLSLQMPIKTATPCAVPTSPSSVVWSAPQFVSASDHKGLLDDIYRFIHHGGGQPIENFHYSGQTTDRDMNEWRPFPAIRKVVSGKHFYLYLNSADKVADMMASYNTLLQTNPALPLNRRVAQGYVKDADKQTRWFILFHGHDYGTYGRSHYYDHVCNIQPSEKQRILSALRAGRSVAKALDQFRTSRVSIGGLKNAGIRFLENEQAVVHLREPVSQQEINTIDELHADARITIIVTYLLLSGDKNTITRQPYWSDLVEHLKVRSLFNTSEKMALIKQNRLVDIPHLANNTLRVIRILANMLCWGDDPDPAFSPLTLKVVDEQLAFLIHFFNQPVLKTVSGDDGKLHDLRVLASGQLAKAYSSNLRYFGEGWDCDVCRRNSVEAGGTYVYSCLKCFLDKSGVDACEKCYPGLASEKKYLHANPSLIHPHMLVTANRAFFHRMSRDRFQTPAWQCAGLRDSNYQGTLTACRMNSENIPNEETIYYCPYCQEGICSTCRVILENYPHLRDQTPFCKTGNMPARSPASCESPRW